MFQVFFLYSSLYRIIILNNDFRDWRDASAVKSTCSWGSCKTPSLLLNTHMSPYSMGSNALFRPLQAPGTYTMHTDHASKTFITIKYMLKEMTQNSKLAQWVKALAAKSDYLSFIFKTYRVEERPNSHKLPSDLHVGPKACAHTHIPPLNQ